MAIRCGWVAVVVLLLLSSPSLAVQVTPIDEVVNFVNVREEASTQTASIGQLHPGEQAELLGEVPRWYRVRLSDGTEGFVSKRWTDPVPETAADVFFQVHFVDVGTGDSAILDVGDREIVIDGGDSTRVLHDYNEDREIIDGAIELVVVTHGDSDHWKGLPRLLGFDGIGTTTANVLEFWEPGFDRDCRSLASYDTFISNAQGLSGVQFRRPLETTHTPAVISGQPAPITLASIPGVTLTLLHSDATPPASNNDCSYRINNASIVLMPEVQGFRFLFTGDANGKERDEASPGTPGHIEELLLALEASHPGTLKADVLKVPHHGSETASTQAFIDAVDPEFVIISASTRHHLPRSTVVDRYDNGARVILRTDEDRSNDTDHILCFRNDAGDLDCNFETVLGE